MPDTQVVKCAKCDVVLQGNVVDTQSNDRFSCPSCGEGDTYENVMREVGDSALDQMGDAFTKTIKSALRGSKHLTFKEKHRPKKSRRFFIDLSLH